MNLKDLLTKIEESSYSLDSDDLIKLGRFTHDLSLEIFKRLSLQEDYPFSSDKNKLMELRFREPFLFPPNRLSYLEILFMTDKEAKSKLKELKSIVSSTKSNN